MDKPSADDAFPPDEPEAFMPGQWVQLTDTNRRGQIVAIDEDRRRAKVRIGSIQWMVALDRLGPIVEPEPGNAQSQLGGRKIAPRRELFREIDLHGMRVLEALEALDKFLDSAMADCVDEVRVVHGLGAGKLRAAVGDYLTGHHHVGRFHFGGPHQGSLGTTIIILKGAG